VGTPGAGGRNDYTPYPDGPSNRLHPTIDFVPADEGAPYKKPWEWEDFAAGMGDECSGGGSAWVRGQIGADSEVDYDSEAYIVGQIIGIGLDLATGGKGQAVKIPGRAARAIKGAPKVGKQVEAAAEEVIEAWRRHDLGDEILEIPESFIKKAREKYPRKSDKMEKHHPHPMYLGGEKAQELWEIPAYVHQLITSRFRLLHPYGQNTSITREQMKSDYAKIFAEEIWP
jgi:hypothetical protein